MAMWKIRSCPKCGGDVFLDIDEETWFEHCLQCGYTGPKSNIECPQCGSEMYYELGRYYCPHCSYISGCPATSNSNHWSG
jgi:ribosomal protein S27AE